MSLFYLFYSLVFLFVIDQSGQVRSCSAQVSWAAGQKSLTWISFIILLAISYLSPCSFLFFIHSATDVFPYVSSLEHTFFLHFQLKSCFGLNKKGWFSLQPRLNTFCPFVRWTKPTCCCKTELFVFPPFSSPLKPVLIVLYCEPQPCEVLLLPSLISSCLHFTSLHFTLIIFSLHCSALSFSSCELLRREERDSGLSIVPSVQGPSHSQTSHHTHAELMRGEEILT